MKPLKEKAVRFIDEYLVDMNATQAAIRAGYSEKSAKKQGCRFMRDPRIRELLDVKRKELAARVGADQESIIRELVKIAYSDIRKNLTWGPDGVKLIASTELSDADAASVSEVGETKGRSPTLRLKKHDKIRALELLGNHIGMFIKRHEVTGANGEPIGAGPILNIGFGNGGPGSDTGSEGT